MYDKLRRTAAEIMADLSSSSSLEAAEQLRDELYGENGYVFSSDSDIRRHIPNILTGLVLRAADELVSALKSGSCELAGDIAGAIRALPDEEYLSDKERMTDYFVSNIHKLNEKYGRVVLPTLV